MLVTTIQARMGSTRLPGKMLMEIGGRSTLAWVIQAAREIPADLVVVATSTGSEDDAIAAAAAAAGVRCIRGPDEDVLARFCLVAEQTEADALIRISGDCPFLDPDVGRAVVGLFHSVKVDYAGTVKPRSLPLGFDVEVVTRDALKKMDERATGHHRAHVTSFAYTYPELFAAAGVVFSPPAGELRVTLDTPADLRLMRSLRAELGDGVLSWRVIADLLRSRPDLRAINSTVDQKDLAQG